MEKHWNQLPIQKFKLEEETDELLQKEFHYIPQAQARDDQDDQHSQDVLPQEVVFQTIYTQSLALKARVVQLPSTKLCKLHSLA